MRFDVVRPQRCLKQRGRILAELHEFWQSTYEPVDHPGLRRVPILDARDRTRAHVHETGSVVAEQEDWRCCEILHDPKQFFVDHAEQALHLGYDVDWDRFRWHLGRYCAS